MLAAWILQSPYQPTERTEGKINALLLCHPDNSDSDDGHRGKILPAEQKKLQLKTIKRGPTSPDEVPLERLVPVQGRCRAGWDSFQESCYLFTTTNTAAWRKAEDQCRSSGGHLLVINNVEELVSPD
ncbi:asialoglycoprotein receptor-like 1 isoform X2 [Cyprinodon tularosa]|uniref:asialoglycoprotein receptor-like 1 isoform X2 n=1 Tax=Cyprinodon tularosa TaxID=77115 RepID=UPI0018E21E45|nr:asialoglycoprotein receptor-like 1 isoform X2 [Cyprinodon tularosa]